MMHHFDKLFGGTRSGSRRRPASGPASEQAAVAIRRGAPADAARLHDLAGLDSGRPLEGAVLVAVVDGTIRAALALGDGRVLADPFAPSAANVEVLRLRARQLRNAGSPREARPAPRRLAGRVRA